MSISALFSSYAVPGVTSIIVTPSLVYLETLTAYDYTPITMSTSGRRASQTASLNKKSTVLPVVSTPCQSTVGTNVWWRYSIQILVQWKRLAHARLEENWHPICPRAVLAHLEIHVINLVPLVGPWIQATGNQIRNWAFATHIPCFLAPDQNVSPICDLKLHGILTNLLDHQRIFQARGTQHRNPSNGLWNIETRCSKSSGRSGQILRCLEEGANGTMIFIKVSVQKLGKKAKKIRQIPHLFPFITDADGRSQFADGLGSTAAKPLKWNTIVMDWVAYSGDSFSNDDDLDVIIVLADIKALGLLTTSNPSINFNHTICELASSIEKGKLHLQVDGFKI